MSILPTIRPEAYDLYWYYAAERQHMFWNYQAALPRPWTRDPILQTYKFCNVFRATDRVSQYLIREVIYARPLPTDQLLMNIVLFRLFSLPATWQAICAELGGPPELMDLQNGRLLAAIERARQQNGKLYTNAFILCASNAYGVPSKHENHVALVRDMFVRHRLADRILAAASLRQLYELLKTFPLIGPFMAYQLAIDLNYAPQLAFDESEFTVAGPGALRGIAKAFVSTGSLRPADVILMMQARQADEFARLGLTPADLYGRPMQAIDCQGTFCELDKYTRVALPELVSARRRIKQRYRSARAPQQLFLPPKWKLSQGGTR